jgi:hypothetical protein
MLWDGDIFVGHDVFAEKANELPILFPDEFSSI